MELALQQIGLDALLPFEGTAAMRIGLIDGPVEASHPALAGARIEVTGSGGASRCAVADAYACQHGTFIAGILTGIRPRATLLTRAVFSEHVATGSIPVAAADVVADAIFDAIAAGARVINLSVGVVQPTARQRETLAAACEHARRRDVLVIAAAGNQGRVGPLPLVEHAWVIPVASSFPDGRADLQSNLGPGIGRRGLRAPSQTESAIPPDRIVTMRGTSVAAAFVSATAALLLELEPRRSGADVRAALLANPGRGRSIVPPMLDARASLAALRRGR